MAEPIKKKFTRDDLLKFSKSTELAIKLIEDDSSGGDNGTEVKILHLLKPITVTGSNPSPNGDPMRVTGTEVYVAADNIDKLLEGLEEVDDILTYKGTMHLDVSKPNGRNNSSGQFVITKPAKIWLTETKFSRGGAALRTNQTNNLNNFISNMFKGGKAVDLTAETTTTTTGNAAGGEKNDEPVVVPNVTGN